MVATTISLPALYLREMSGVVGEYGVNEKNWLKSLGVSIPQDGDAFVELSLPTFRRMVAEGKALTDPASFSLQVGQRLLVNSHGILGYAAMSSKSQRQLTELMEQFQSLRTDVFTITQATVDGEFRVIFHEIDGLKEARQWALETIVLGMKNIYDFTSMGECAVAYVAFAMDVPFNAALIRAYLKCDVRFQLPWTGLALNEHSVDRPLKMANAGGFAEATKLCMQELNDKHEQIKLSDRIRRRLLNSVGNFPSLETTASSLNLTPRTMHRKLVREETSYKEILDETRHSLAIRYLEMKTMTVKEVAFTLGYSDVANFRRAFKRWEGIPPLSYATQNS